MAAPGETKEQARMSSRPSRSHSPHDITRKGTSKKKNNGRATRSHNIRRGNNRQNGFHNNHHSTGHRRRAIHPQQQQHIQIPTVEVMSDAPQQSEELRNTLVSLNLYDSEDALRQRRLSLESLEELTCKWAQSLVPPTGSLNSNKWHRPRVALVSFGSYRLGVHRPGADMDLLALCPPNCTRGDFFTSLVNLLRDDARVTDVHPIPAAYTPVIKFYFNHFAVDLVFARLSDASKLTAQPPITTATSQLRDILLTPRYEHRIDDSDLLGVDEAGSRSLNGVRVAQMLLTLVEPNLEEFRLTLRAVKEWALVHGLYSNVLGFLGGVNCAILVANICMRHPDALPSTLLRLFFQTYANWRWPTPVVLTPIVTQPPPGVNMLPVWNPEMNPRDRMHVMPIITPAYPSMNSSYNVGYPQLRRIQIELSEADRIVAGIEAGKNSWSQLFRGNDFFRRHMHFLQVDISADNANEFLEWFRLCESRLRILIAGLESPEYGVQAYPFAKFFDLKYSSSGRLIGLGKSDENCKHGSCFFVALRFAYGVENVDLRYCTSEFLHKINSWEGRRQGMDLTIEHTRQNQLPVYVFSNGEQDMQEDVVPLEPEAEATDRPPIDPNKAPPSPSSMQAGGVANNQKLLGGGQESFQDLVSGPSVPSPAKRART